MLSQNFANPSGILDHLASADPISPAAIKAAIAGAICAGSSLDCRERRDGRFVGGVQDEWRRILACPLG